MKVDNNLLIQKAASTNLAEASSSHNIQKPSPKLADSSGVDHSSIKSSQSERPPHPHDSTRVSAIIQNTITKIQSSTSALQKIEKALQSGKELAVEASRENSSLQHRQELQKKLHPINQQIDQTNQTIAHTPSGADFIKGKINPNDANIVQSLKSDWFESAENVIAQRYGLSGDGSVLKVVLDEGDPKYLAAISYMTDDTGKAATEILHINAKAAVPATLPNGGLAPEYDDRIIAHEMVHAIMGRSMNYASMPSWFKEGTAEFLAGADERIATSLNNNGGGMSGALVLQKDFGDGTNRTWKDDSDHYSAATLAVRYLHDNIKANGHKGGIKDLMADLSANPDEDLDEALSHVSSFQNVREFAKTYVKEGKGSEYIDKLAQNHVFSNADVGAIGGLDVDGGPVLSAESVIPDINAYSEHPLKHFEIQWPKQFMTASSGAAVKLPSQSAMISGQFDSNTLGTQNIDVINDPKGSIDRFDKALSMVAKERARLGKIENQLSHSLRQQNIRNDGPIHQQHLLQARKELSSPDLLASQANNTPERVAQLL